MESPQLSGLWLVPGGSGAALQTRFHRASPSSTQGNAPRGGATQTMQDEGSGEECLQLGQRVTGGWAWGLPPCPQELAKGSLGLRGVTGVKMVVH